MEAVDSKIGTGGSSKNKVEMVASARNTFASKASPLLSSSLLLLLLITLNL